MEGPHEGEEEEEEREEGGGGGGTGEEVAAERIYYPRERSRGSPKRGEDRA